jgi:hypothetical protein
MQSYAAVVAALQFYHSDSALDSDSDPSMMLKQQWRISPVSINECLHTSQVCLIGSFMLVTG